MNAMTQYDRWLNHNGLDAASKAELQAISGNTAEIEDRFFMNLKFGTGGLRGILGMGTNRMNRYTVRRAAAGLAQEMLAEHPDAKTRGIVIAHDSRHGSAEFALDSALVIAQCGIRAYLFDELRPTPELSFAIRHLNTVSGIVITASHNPAEYNGFKAYGADGGQITLETADAVLRKMDAIDPLDVPMMEKAAAEKAGLLCWIGEAVDRAYIDHVLSLRPDPTLLSRTGVDLKIVYTPLHGAGNKPVRRALAEAGFKNVTVVKEQEMPDGAFPTVKSPNPENPEAFTLAAGYADRLDADLIVGTDPDSDRMGLMVKRASKWTPLTGNQVGCLMLAYIIAAKKPDKGAYAVTTIVSTRMVDAIAQKHGVDVYRVLTGFKFIGETIDRMEQKGNHAFLLGFEESYGYLTGGYIRDKDAVIASVLACEMAAYYKTRGMNLLDALDALFAEYGCYQERLITVTMPGMDGMAKREKTMENLRKNPPRDVMGHRVEEALDFSAGGVMGLPKADVLMYRLEKNGWLCVRPSGTEPKLKVYLGICEADKAVAVDEADKMRAFAADLIARY